MDFKQAFDKYREGTATDEQAAYVQAEIEKQELIEDYLAMRLDQELGEMPVSEEAKDEAKKVRKKVSRKQLRLIVITLLALVMVAAIVIMIPLYLGYNPNRGYAIKGEYGTEFNMQFETDLGMVYEVFKPGEIALWPEAKWGGPGRHDIRYMKHDMFFNKDTWMYNTMRYNWLDRSSSLDEVMGHITMYADGFFFFNRSDEFKGWDENTFEDNVERYLFTEEKHQEELAKLNQLHETAYVSTYFSMNETLSTADFLKLKDKYTNLKFVYCAVASDGRIVVGFRPQLFLGSVYDVGDEKYPHLVLDPDYENDPAALEQHYLSMMKYMRENKKMTDALNVGSQEVFDRSYEYATEHGVQIYGLLVYGSPGDVLEFEQNEDVYSIYVDNAKLAEFVH